MLRSDPTGLATSSFSRHLRRLAGGVLALALGLGSLAAAQAQLASWSFTGLLGNEASVAASTTPGSHVTGVALTRGAGLAANTGGGSFNSNGWTAEATDYLAFGITVEAGYVGAATSLQIGTRSSNSGPGHLGLYASTDNFTTPLATFTQSGTNDNNQTITLSLQGLRGTVTFRIRPTDTVSANGGTTASAGTFRIGTSGTPTMVLNGSVVPDTGLVDGSCGTSNGQTLPTAPTTGLCAAGTPSAVSGIGPWTWTCAGTGGGATASCSANATVVGTNGACGADDRMPLSSTPTQLCAAGTPSAITGTGPWHWTCAGSGAGTSATCGSTLATTDGGIKIVHVNDQHARVTPHKWIIPNRTNPTTTFENVGGAAYLGAKMMSLASTKPNTLVLDAGDISEGNPIGDMGGNGVMTGYLTLLHQKLVRQRGRGLDGVVVGNHDVRDTTYIANMDAMRAAGVPLLSANLRDKATGLPRYAPYHVVTLPGGQKVGVIGYTTSTSQVGASLSSTLEVVECDWSGSAAPCHMADYVNELRNVHGVGMVVLLSHVGHSAMVDPPAGTAPLLADTAAARVPEVVVSGHWHTWTDTVWQPHILNYKTIFTESSSYLKYVGELNVTDVGQYVGSQQHVTRNADITPDPDIQAFVDARIAEYNAANPGHPWDEVVGYTADDLLLNDNYRWWSANEYPWQGNNTAGQWIVDGVKWKCAQLFGSCDLAIETGGGVRSDIPAGPVTLTQVHEVFPWKDDWFYRINMTGQDIINFLKEVNLNAGFSRELQVTAVDLVPTQVLFNGQPIELSRTYTVGINNYMYEHPPSGYTWPDTAPLVDTTLIRDGLLEFMRTQHGTPANAYTIGGKRLFLNGAFSGGYRAVVTMIADQDARPTFNTAFLRLLSATPDTLARRGTDEVPASLVNADGTVNAGNPLASQEWYRSYLGFKPGALKQGDIVEVWGKAGAYGGNPEFVDQEGILADGVEFNVVGTDASLAKPEYMASIGQMLDGNHKNRYVRFLARKTGTSSVADAFGQTLGIWGKGGYTAATLPGNVGDTLLITGVLTMENFGYRLRSDSAAVTATPLPAPSGLQSHVTPLGGTATGSIALSATASVSAGQYVLGPVADAQVASANAGTNYGSSNNLFIQSSNSTVPSQFGNERAWLRFDLSSIPAGATIASATLELWNWRSAGASLPAEVRGSTVNTWTEGAITWANQPAFGAVLDTRTLQGGVKDTWYTWSVGSFVQQQLGSPDRLATLMVKAVTENSADSPAPSYGFDAKEFGSNAPVLRVTVQSAGAAVASVRYFYRFSADNQAWTAWTAYGSPVATAPYAATFTFPDGNGYYEFYSQATDTANTVEAAPPFAHTAIRYQAAPGPQPQSIDFPTVPALAVGATAQLTATATSGLPVSFSSATPATCSVSGVTLTALAIGTCTVEASQPGNASWQPAAPVSRSAAVSGLSQSITFDQPADAALDAGTVTVSATASSGLAVVFTSQTPAVCTVTGFTVTLVSVGACSVAADQAGDTVHTAAATVVRTFQVTAATADPRTNDAPLPAWLVLVLGLGLAEGIRRRRRS